MNYSQVQNTTEDHTNSNFNSDKKKGIGEYQLMTQSDLYFKM